jgi:hypothetical protein
VIPKIYSSMQVVFETELQGECGVSSSQKLKPSNAIQLISYNTVFIEKCHVEFKKCISF